MPGHHRYGSELAHSAGITQNNIKQDEYRFIDTTFNSLSNKVDSLEETLQANHRMIKHSIMLNMLNNRFTPEELTEQLQSLSALLIC